MDSTMTIAAARAMALADVACREHAWLPLLASQRDRAQGTGVPAAGFGAVAPTQLTSMDVVYSDRGRPPV